MASPKVLKGRIVVYSIVGCPHCLQAKSTLQDLGPCHLLTYLYLFSNNLTIWNLEYLLNQAVTPVEYLLPIKRTGSLTYFEVFAPP